ncbi:hypothetical protein DPMN_061686 [Dreissena polymorpha]|uniref:Uncharacterized protein n=1 Tax=Dreissena polymorpha TaxID=45954 RepID=A0A9D4C870_DREPO|nr:hypothetical protein DPMN_061686 [Dreissena polymorpha]
MNIYRKNKSPVTGDTIDDNVYSEFNSGWPSNEFDSTYALDNGEFDKKDADETRNPANENVEAGDNLRNEENAIVDAKRIRALGSANPEILVRVKAPDESEAIGRTRYNIEIFGSNESSAPAVCERSETTYATSRVSFQKYSEDSSIGDKSRNNSLEADNLDPGGQESMAKLKETDDDEEVVENVFYEPPELWSVHDVKHADKMASLRRESETMFREELQDSARSYKFSGSTGLYYEPPEEDQDTPANDRGNGVADEEHIYEDDESLYRNCETANSGGWLSFDHDSALAWNRGKQLSTQCNIDNKYERKGGKANLNECVHESYDHEEESISNVNIHPDPEEHIYENGMLMAKTLYEAPKNNFGRNNAANGRGSIDKERIYDVPNFNNP